jgi:hypothetical protein
MPAPLRHAGDEKGCVTMSAESVQNETWRKSRPVMPGYGAPEGLDGTLEWSEVAARLAAGKTYWVCTASSEGVPHAVPVWAAFVDDTFYIGAGGPRTVRNLRENPRVSVHLESGSEVVIAEGTVESGPPDPSVVPAVDDQYGEKYDWRPSSESPDGGIGDGWHILRPAKVIAWASFPADATRWTRLHSGSA